MKFQSCPLDSSWRAWYLDKTRAVPLQDAARVQANAQQEPQTFLHAITPDWEIAADDARYMPSDDPNFEPGSPNHSHTEFELDGLVVHVDRLAARRGGPGSSYTEYRIFWNGELQGRGGRFGTSLGAGGNDLPARALLPNGQLLVVGKRDGDEIAVWTAMTL
ncbi:MAG: hypothetical protein EYC68_08275 [Chloroflexota bacterium]|nr:MAG: hypothetical protein EYC68_08275 [Chloroflexota bacterium]